MRDWTRQNLRRWLINRELDNSLLFKLTCFLIITVNFFWIIGAIRLKITRWDEEITSSIRLFQFSEASFINKILIKNEFLCVLVFHNAFNNIGVPRSESRGVPGLAQALCGSLRLTVLKKHLSRYDLDQLLRNSQVLIVKHFPTQFFVHEFWAAVFLQLIGLLGLHGPGNCCSLSRGGHS